MVLKTERLTTDTKSLVTVKGTKDGLVFFIDEYTSLDDILAYLSVLLEGENARIFSGPNVGVVVDYGCRQLSHSDVCKLLNPFLLKENFVLKEWGPRTHARRALFMNRHDSSGQSIFRGTVRAGQQLLFEGDVVVIGDVNPGGEIQATGDIFVFGRLCGTAHAGIHGNHHAIVAATEFVPMQLRIASVVSRAPEVAGRALHTFMEFAYLNEGNMAVDKMKYYSSVRQQYEEISDARKP